MPRTPDGGWILDDRDDFEPYRPAPAPILDGWDPTQPRDDSGRWSAAEGETAPTGGASEDGELRTDSAARRPRRGT